MKIQLASTLPFTPVQLDSRHVEPRRSVAQLQTHSNGIDFVQPVYEFKHSDDEVVSYLVDPTEKVQIESQHSLSITAANDNYAKVESEMIWIEHNDSMTYKPYAFLVMSAITQLVSKWDGVVYRTPSGERLRESAFQATLQVVDACVCPQGRLWVMVNLTSENASGAVLQNRTAVRQLGWVPVAA